MVTTLQVSNLSKSFANLLFSGVDLQARQPEKIGLIGDNGSGKSTFLKIIAGRNESDLGNVEWSRGAKIGYLEQEIVADTYEVSGGEKKILRLTELFYSDYDAILLDEPDNHLDLDHKLWFEELVNNYEGIVIVISHDRKFLETCVDHIWYLIEGQIRDYPFGYDKFKDVFEGEMAARSKLWEFQEKERVRLWEFVKQMQVKAAANSKVTGAYHNAVHRYERWVRDMVTKPPEEKKMKLEISLSEQHRKKTAIYLSNICKHYGDVEVLKDLKLHTFCGEKIAIAAPNGSGKSTLLNIIGNKLTPDGGEVEVGNNLVFGYYTQEHVQALNDEETMVGEVQKAKAFSWYEAVGYLKRFLFNETQAKGKVKYLSGGQKSRLQLAKFLATNPDILLLDEPTNHLDLRTVLALENFLKEYEGTLILVSHDREFVDNTCQIIYQLKEGKLVRE